MTRVLNADNPNKITILFKPPSYLQLMLFNYFNFYCTCTFERKKLFFFIIINSNFHQKMIISSSYIWIFSFFKWP